MTARYGLHNLPTTSFHKAGLRDIPVELDRVVAAIYIRTDFAPSHYFHETRQCLRLALSDLARREVLRRSPRVDHHAYWLKKW